MCKKKFRTFTIDDISIQKLKVLADLYCDGNRSAMLRDLIFVAHEKYLSDMLGYHAELERIAKARVTRAALEDYVEETGGSTKGILDYMDKRWKRQMKAKSEMQSTVKE